MMIPFRESSGGNCQVKAILQYCAKVTITIIDENRDNRELSAIFERYFD